MSSDLQNHLAKALNGLNKSLGRQTRKIVVSLCEVNHNHGVGIMLHRLFPDTSDIISIRSTDLYKGDHYFGSESFCLGQIDSTLHDVLSKVRVDLSGIHPSAILIVPYFPADFLMGIALKRLYDCPLCVFIMDDQNIYSHAVDDELVDQLLDVADLCFGISRPLCEAYEHKFNRKFWFFPPVIENRLIQQELSSVVASRLSFEARGILIGNIWCQRWLDQLRPLCRESGVKIEWYGNPNRNWIAFQELELEADGIYFNGFVHEDELIRKLQEASFALILTGSSDHPDDRPELMNLSLPSRSCFMTATASIPLLVLGSHNSAVAKFVHAAKLGVVCPYESESFVDAVKHICSADYQLKYRNNSLSVAKQLGADGMGQWLWDSLDQKRPLDLHFEKLWPQSDDKYQRVLITACETNFRHGTGVLLKRVFPREEGMISVRTNDFYEGDQQWGGKSYLISDQDVDRKKLFASVISLLGSHSGIKQLFCVPYDAKSLVVAIILKEVFNVPLAIWIMDDQNVATNVIPDKTMNEFLCKADIRFATHPELRDAYESKYGLKFWLLPAVVPSKLIAANPCKPPNINLAKIRGALVGSVWSLQWFKNLCNSLQGAEISLDWFGNSQYYWLSDTDSELNQKGLFPQGILVENRLAEKLKDYPFVVVPTGTLDDRDDQSHLSKLSLPGRILFVVATSNSPIILLGSQSTSAANFVNHFKIGIVCDYTPDALKKAVAYVLDPSHQQELRQNAFKVAQRFSDRAIDDWIWQSLEIGQAADNRFESLFPRAPIDLVHFMEPPVPELVSREYVPAYQLARRLKLNGYCPNFAIDIGAGTGIWAHTTSLIYPEADHILIDPLLARYKLDSSSCYFDKIPNARLLEVAVSNAAGEACFQVSADLYRSSMLNSTDPGADETVVVPVTTLDQIAIDENISGHGILRLDLQGGEYLVLEGATNFLNHIDLIIVVLPFACSDQKPFVLVQVLNLLDGLGFRYYDDARECRSPIDGALLRRDVAFIRKGLLVPALSPNLA